jgi:hypothetical protein
MLAEAFQFAKQNWSSILLTILLLSVFVMTIVNIIATTELSRNTKSIGDYSKAYQYAYFAAVILTACNAWLKIDK